MNRLIVLGSIVVFGLWPSTGESAVLSNVEVVSAGTGDGFYEDQVQAWQFATEVEVVSSASHEVRARLRAVVAADHDTAINLVRQQLIVFRILLRVEAQTGEEWSLGVDSLLQGGLTVVDDDMDPFRFGRAAIQSINPSTGAAFFNCFPQPAVQCEILTGLSDEVLQSSTTAHVPFSEPYSSVVWGSGPRDVVLEFRYGLTATSSMKETAVRFGLPGSLGISADDYPGLGERSVEKDGHSVTVLLRFSDRVCGDEPRPCPEFEPDAWPQAHHGLWSGWQYDNCYNYAVDRVSGVAMNPGDYAGVPFEARPNERLECADVAAAAAADGLNFICDDVPNGHDLCDLSSVAELDSYCQAEDSCLTFLAVRPGPCRSPTFSELASGVGIKDCDYHWYRLDRNGTWSHKPGGLEARRYDVGGSEIGDPRTADRGGYEEACGFFCVACELAGEPASAEISSVATLGGSWIEVTYVTNSGLRNPSGRIVSTERIEEIMSRLISLTPVPNPNWSFDLGDSFILLVPSNLPEFPGGPAGFVRIADGIVEISDGATSEFFSDDTDLETELVASFESTAATVPAMGSGAGLVFLGCVLTAGAVGILRRVAVKGL
ncbi:MAG: hypothetical protein WEF50_10760 [Myxococcota bacterium]